MRRTRIPFQKTFSPDYVVELAREMRKDMTEAEKALWSRIRRQQVDGLRFRKQHPIGRYIVDFCCFDSRLIVEVDGGVHDKRKEYDQNRDAFLAGGGYTVLRFPNDEVLQRIEKVIEAIRNAVQKRSEAR
ncbi:MAG: endonuclease domain-containing protein [Candidatus Latescibacterota bacterium]